MSHLILQFTKYKKVTEEQLEILKYNMENAEWISQKECENAN